MTDLRCHPQRLMIVVAALAGVASLTMLWFVGIDGVEVYGVECGGRCVCAASLLALATVGLGPRAAPLAPWERALLTSAAAVALLVGGWNCRVIAGIGVRELMREGVWAAARLGGGVPVAATSAVATIGASVAWTGRRREVARAGA